MPKSILALNAGSSSLKFGLFACDDVGEARRLAKGQIAAKDGAVQLQATDGEEGALERSWPGPTDHDRRIECLIQWVERANGDVALAAVGHRIVHGGCRFTSPVLATAETVKEIEALAPLAPLHQPLGLAPVHAVGRLRPELPQVCCFDTAFHAGLQPPVSRYAIPRRFEAEGVRRYGFHGLSYDYIAGRLAEISPVLPEKRSVVAHLGSGASLCAMRHGRSCDTTMGFSALDGLVMATRPGALDPGVLIHLQQTNGLTLDRLIEVLYHESGLLGVSGISGDMRRLLDNPEPAAEEAVELFVFRAARETAALATTLQGLECFVFTGGIGEHSWQIREMIAERLAWLGMTIDRERNRAGAERIDTPGSRVEVYVLPTDEEAIIARDAVALLSQGK